MGLDLGAELVLGVPFDFVNTATLELLALSGIEEFGASGDQEEA